MILLSEQRCVEAYAEQALWATNSRAAALLRMAGDEDGHRK